MWGHECVITSLLENVVSWKIKRGGPHPSGYPRARCLSLSPRTHKHRPTDRGTVLYHYSFTHHLKSSNQAPSTAQHTLDGHRGGSRRWDVLCVGSELGKGVLVRELDLREKGARETRAGVGYETELLVQVQRQLVRAPIL